MNSEFEFINNIKSKYRLDKLGDDCAVLPKDDTTDLLLTADLLIEEIDFRLDWTTPGLLGEKALAVSLSDIAAMCGEPKWAMLSIGVPENLWKTGFVDRFYEGWFRLAGQFKVELVGGDVSRSPDKLVIDSIVGGEAAKGKAVLRSTARPGDQIFVSGTLGGAAAGLKLVEQGHRFPPEVLARGRCDDDNAVLNLTLHQLQAAPALDLAKYLINHNIPTSAIDVSDGLSSDLQHICDPSVVGARIDFDSLPINGLLSGLFPPDECEDMALNGGEDFLLLFTTRPNVTDIPGQLVTRIGEITPDAGRVELVRSSGTEVLVPRGYRHF